MKKGSTGKSSKKASSDSGNKLSIVAVIAVVLLLGGMVVYGKAMPEGMANLIGLSLNGVKSPAANVQIKGATPSAGANANINKAVEQVNNPPQAGSRWRALMPGFYPQVIKEKQTLVMVQNLGDEPTHICWEYKDDQGRMWRNSCDWSEIDHGETSFAPSGFDRNCDVGDRAIGLPCNGVLYIYSENYNVPILPAGNDCMVTDDGDNSTKVCTNLIFVKDSDLD